MGIEIYMDIISNDGHFELGTQTALGQFTNEVSRERGEGVTQILTGGGEVA